MTYVASLGFPVPKIYEARGTDLVMERFAAPTMLQALLSRGIRPRSAPRCCSACIASCTGCHRG